MSWSWSYGSWIYNYLCNQCLSPLMLWGVQQTLCDKVCWWHATGLWFSQSPPVSSTNKTDRHDITEILLKVALKHHPTNKQTNKYNLICKRQFSVFWLGSSIVCIFRRVYKLIILIAGTTFVSNVNKFTTAWCLIRGAFYLQNHASDFFENQKHVLCEIKTLWFT